MKLQNKRLIAAFLAGFCVLGTPAPAFASAQDFSARAYNYGPGYDNLSSADRYAHYQWGLRNEGDLQYVEIVNRLASRNPALAEFIDIAHLMQEDLPESLSGPDLYVQRTTRAVKGVDINIQPAWKQYDSGSETPQPVIVAVLDTGIDFSHPDLAGAAWVNEDEIPGDGIDNDGNGYVDDISGWNFFDHNSQIFSGTDDSHGTHAAGTIAAQRGGGGGIAGIADQNYVKLMSLKVLGTEEGKGAEEDIIEAVRYAEKNGASICNLSFGTATYYPELEKVMRESSMLFVVSAGNGNSEGVGIDVDNSTEKDYPTCYQLDNCISVANLLFNGALDSTSNYGASSVDIAAPGTYILSTSANGGYGYMSGTSMAAPMVTGIAAMVHSCRPELSMAEVKNAVLSTARTLPALEGKLVTGGIPDAYAALNYGRETPQADTATASNAQ